MEDIEPCPFCAGEAELDEESEDAVFVRCDTCSAQGPAHTPDDVDEAVRVWNEVSVLALEEEED